MSDRSGAKVRGLDSLTGDFLRWLSTEPRSYVDVMQAWRSSCPRLSVFEDALADGLIQIQRGGAGPDSAVTLTQKGQALIAPSRGKGVSPLQ